MCLRQRPSFQSNNVSDVGLQRRVTRWHALAAVVGGILGTGIYIRPASIAQWVGSSSWILAVWVGAGLLSLAGAITYSQLAARLPRPGGEYVFLQNTPGDFPALAQSVLLRLPPWLPTMDGLTSR